jgi:putative transposase
MYRRRKLFEDEEAVRLLGDVMREVRKDAPFRTTAMVVLPDHLHCIWSLPRGDDDYPTRWKQIKRDFTVRWITDGDEDDDYASTSRQARGEEAVWQRRYWEHVVEDERELEALCDYIHYNPVKHGYTTSPAAWPWSTFFRFVASGDYAPDWGNTVPSSIDRAVSIVGE